MLGDNPSMGPYATDLPASGNATGTVTGGSLGAANQVWLDSVLAAYPNAQATVTTAQKQNWLIELGLGAIDYTTIESEIAAMDQASMLTVTSLPSWVLPAGLGLLAVMFLRGRRR